MLCQPTNLPMLVPIADMVHQLLAQAMVMVLQMKVLIAVMVPQLYWTRRLHFVVVPKRSIDQNLRRRSRNGNDKRRRAKQYHLCTCCSAWPGKPRRDILEDFQWSLQCRIQFRWDLP